MADPFHCENVYSQLGAKAFNLHHVVKSSRPICVELLRGIFQVLVEQALQGYFPGRHFSSRRMSKHGYFLKITSRGIYAHPGPLSELFCSFTFGARGAVSLLSEVMFCRLNCSPLHHQAGWGTRPHHSPAPLSGLVHFASSSSQACLAFAVSAVCSFF